MARRPGIAAHMSRPPCEPSPRLFAQRHRRPFSPSAVGREEARLGRRDSRFNKRAVSNGGKSPLEAALFLGKLSGDWRAVAYAMLIVTVFDFTLLP